MYEIGNRDPIKEGMQFNLDRLPENEKERIQKILKWDGEGFDLRTHVVDPKTGALLKFQPYRRICDGSEITYLRKDDNGIDRKYSESGKCTDPGVPVPIQVEAKAKNDKRVS